MIRDIKDKGEQARQTNWEKYVPSKESIKYKSAWCVLESAGSLEKAGSLERRGLRR